MCNAFPGLLLSAVEKMDGLELVPFAGLDGLEAVPFLLGVVSPLDLVAVEDVDVDLVGPSTGHVEDDLLAGFEDGRHLDPGLASGTRLASLEDVGAGRVLDHGDPATEPAALAHEEQTAVGLVRAWNDHDRALGLCLDDLELALGQDRTAGLDLGALPGALLRGVVLGLGLLSRILVHTLVELGTPVVGHDGVGGDGLDVLDGQELAIPLVPPEDEVDSEGRERIVPELPVSAHVDVSHYSTSASARDSQFCCCQTSNSPVGMVLYPSHEKISTRPRPQRRPVSA